MPIRGIALSQNRTAARPVPFDANLRRYEPPELSLIKHDRLGLPSEFKTLDLV